MQFLIQDHYIHTSKPVADPGFPRRGGGVPTSKVGAQTYYLIKCFPKTAWKWKNLDPGGGHASLASPLRSASAETEKLQLDLNGSFFLSACMNVLILNGKLHMDKQQKQV